MVGAAAMVDGVSTLGEGGWVVWVDYLGGAEAVVDGVSAMGMGGW